MMGRFLSRRCSRSDFTLDRTFKLSSFSSAGFCTMLKKPKLVMTHIEHILFREFIYPATRNMQ
jgi:hypothetical protein